MNLKKNHILRSKLILPPINKQRLKKVNKGYSQTELSMIIPKMKKKSKLKKFQSKTIITEKEDETESKNTKLINNENNENKKCEDIQTEKAPEILNISNEGENNDLFIEKDTEEFNEILNFIKDLDFDKYKKDNEIQEALELLKSKMIKDKNANQENTNSNNNSELAQEEEEKEKCDFDEEEIKEMEEEMKKRNNIMKAEEEKKSKEINSLMNSIQTEKKYKADLSKNIKKYVSTGLENNYLKYKIAENISKYDPRFNTIHSYKSIEKIMERTGVIHEDLDKLSEAIQQDIISQNKNKSKYINPNILPYLRSKPILEIES